VNMHPVDWSILGGLILIITYAAWNTKKHTRSVADFLSANRCAGKYMLGVADGIAGLGAITIVAFFEMYYKAGFTATWWQTMQLPVAIILALTGWVQYRYRQTRAMTMAQFFEIRYSRSFRIFAGMTAFIAGTVNFGIFPAVGGRFFQYCCGLPAHMVSVGGFEFDAVYAAIMLALLAISLAFTLMGGQIAVMVTDFLQGAFCNIMFVVVAVFLLWKFDWSIITEAMAQAPENASMVNPLKTSETDNFDAWYFLILIYGTIFTFMGWQGNQGYFCAARSPHEARMGRVIGMFRYLLQNLPVMLVPICAWTFLHHALFTDEAGQVESVLSTIANTQLRDQLRVSVALPHILPAGMLGGFVAVMFAAFVSTHDTYLHSWGSIFIQDVVMPVRQYIFGEMRPMKPRAHIWWLRGSITGVAVFIFLFSLFFNQQQDIYMFFALTGTIYLGWVGAAIVGGLYWKYGNVYGVWAAYFLGIVLAAAGWYVTYFWGNCQGFFETAMPGAWETVLLAWPGLGEEKFPLDAQRLWFFTMLATAGSYIVVSLFCVITGREKAFNMDRLLHRGKYAAESDSAVEAPVRGFRIFRMGPDFTTGDKCLFIGSYLYIGVFFSVFLIGTFIAWKWGIADSTWMRFWRYYCFVMIALSSIITLWLLIGGVRDMRRMLHDLAILQRDHLDDGSVAGGRNLDELDISAEEILDTDNGEEI
jgi:solute:Na+ symporter, SSS family